MNNLFRGTCVTCTSLYYTIDHLVFVFQAFDNEHVKNIGIVQDVDCSYNAKLKMVGPAVTFKNSSNKIRREPPLLGQHTDEVLTSLGYTTKEIELLRSKRVI